MRLFARGLLYVTFLLAGGCGDAPAPRLLETVQPRDLRPADLPTLSYRRKPGGPGSYEIRVEATPDAMEPMDARALITERIDSVTPGGFAAKAVLKVSGPGVPAGQALMSYEVASAGKVSNLKSDKLADPFLGAMIENGKLLYAPMPDGPVAPGISWTGMLTLHLPLAGLPMPLPPLGVDTRLTFTGVEGTDQNKLAVIDVRCESVARQIVSARMTGRYYFSLTHGRAATARLTGTVDASRLGLHEPIPVTVTVSSEALPLLPVPK